MLFVQEPAGMNINVVPDLISADQCTQNEVIFCMPYML